MASIAEEHGGFWESIWKDAANATLRESRKDPNQLMEGDVVQIPDRREKQETRAPEKAHRFRRKGVPSKLRICVLRGGEPRKNEPFRIDIDGALTEGTTDSNGVVEVSISVRAMKATLFVGSEPDQEVYELKLGHLAPASEIKGVKQRLKNLGYEVGEMDAQMSDAFVGALKKFQSENEIEPTGKVTDATREKLASVHGR
jgi:N-acetylmuramoyl-L-alanine amidase